MLDICNSRTVFAYKNRDAACRVPAMVELDYLIRTTSFRALRSDVGIVGEVEIVRARAVEVDPTLHDPRGAGVDRDGEVV